MINTAAAELFGKYIDHLRSRLNTKTVGSLHGIAAVQGEKAKASRNAAKSLISREMKAVAAIRQSRQICQINSVSFPKQTLMNQLPMMSFDRPTSISV